MSTQRPSIAVTVRRRVRRAAGDACGYCRAPQHLVLAPLEVEHIVPRAAGGSDDEDNLWLSCRVCNSYKTSCRSQRDPVTGADTPLFDPRPQVWAEHFRWQTDGACISGPDTRESTGASVRCPRLAACLEWVPYARARRHLTRLLPAVP